MKSLILSIFMLVPLSPQAFSQAIQTPDIDGSWNCSSVVDATDKLLLRSLVKDQVRYLSLSDGDRSIEEYLKLDNQEQNPSNDLTYKSECTQDEIKVVVTSYPFFIAGLADKTHPLKLTFVVTKINEDLLSLVGSGDLFTSDQPTKHFSCAKI